MSLFKCPNCGKTYKTQGAYYKKHIESCVGKTSFTPKIKKQSSTSKSSAQSSAILNRLDKIEARLTTLEQNFQRNMTNRKIKSEIDSIQFFFEVISQKIQLLSKRMLGIQKVYLKDLFVEINKNYNISKDKYSKLLLKLNNSNKIQLEPGSSPDNFSIIDNYGNVFKLIRLLD